MLLVVGLFLVFTFIMDPGSRALSYASYSCDAAGPVKPLTVPAARADGDGGRVAGPSVGVDVVFSF